MIFGLLLRKRNRPYGIAVYKSSDEIIASGERKINETMPKIKRAFEDGYYESYPNGLQEI